MFFHMMLYIYMKVVFNVLCFWLFVKKKQKQRGERESVLKKYFFVLLCYKPKTCHLVEL
jgi:hypothetical protein